MDKTQEIIYALASKVKEKGGIAYFVGGYVRDKLLCLPNKDYDIEIHYISKESLEEILDQIGEKLEFGKSFGIYNIKGFDVDIALPRSERKTGVHHYDFDVDVNPFIGEYEAARRRDFTINSLMENILTGEIIDQFNGINDLNNHIIRHIDADRFIEDPLRVLRAAQFSSRFSFDIADETITLCKSTDISFLSKERIFGELQKALLKSPKPSVFFDNLKKMDQLSYWFPEIANLINVSQRDDYHKEGDVWNHTMMVLDEGAKRLSEVSNKTAFMLACLSHDLGKSECSYIENGIIHSYKHDVVGKDIALRFLKRITNEKDIIRYVLNMVEFHMKPNQYAQENSSIKVTNALFDKSLNPKDLIILSECDNKGRITEKIIPDNSEYLYSRLKIFEETMSKPFVSGKDLIDSGIKPDAYFSELLAYAHKMRLAGVEKELALKQTIAYYKKHK